MQPVHVIIPTHTPRYLDLVLAGLARQTERPATIVVSCDTDDPAIGSLIKAWAPRLGLEVWWVRRAHHGGERLCQVRNNAVRHLSESLAIKTGQLLTLDGDTIASDNCIEGHARLAGQFGVDLIFPYRVDLSETRSRELTAQALYDAPQPLAPSEPESAKLVQRHRRYRRQLLLRRLHLGPLHKPKLLGGHFSVALATYLRLNGFDEHYQGWGFKDDEFAYRAARLGIPCTVAVRDLIAFHLFHPTRQAPGRMADLPTAKRFALRDRLPPVAEHGVRNPLPQHPLTSSLFR